MIVLIKKKKDYNYSIKKKKKHNPIIVNENHSQ